MFKMSKMLKVSKILKVSELSTVFNMSKVSELTKVSKVSKVSIVSVVSRGNYIEPREIEKYQVELSVSQSVSESVNLWSIEMLTHLKLEIKLC